jgi:uncharacterized LabA/DUF88 family protein
MDFKKFRIYLKDKYKVDEAYFFLWFLDEDQQKLYTNVQKAWFIVEFREHNSHMKWTKKWNVDVDIVFEIMQRLIEEDDFNKIVLVSWDWDYIKLVKYLIEKDKFKKILFPNKNYSSLYKPFKDNFWLNLSLKDIKKKLIYTKKLEK